MIEKIAASALDWPPPYLDGYNYHTLLDKPSIVEQGALQHLGENTLVLSRNILGGHVDLQQPETIIDDDNLIYFDILGRQMFNIELFDFAFTLKYHF